MVKRTVRRIQDMKVRNRYTCKAAAAALAAGAVCVLLLLVPGLFAAEQGPGRASAQRDRDGERETDFRFSAPKAFIGFHIGRFFPDANGELYDSITDQLTLEKNDFRAWDFGVDGGYALHERVEAVFGIDIVRRTKTSEFRDWVDEQEQPITQQTRYSLTPITGGLKFPLLPRGRRAGRLAWLPSKAVPYIGGGAGVIWYRFEQSGDFVDFQTYEIFPAVLESSGWTATGYLGGGMDIHIGKGVYFNLDLRYMWAKPELGADFVSFDPLSFSGARATAGLKFYF